MHPISICLLLTISLCDQRVSRRYVFNAANLLASSESLHLLNDRQYRLIAFKEILDGTSMQPFEMRM